MSLFLDRFYKECEQKGYSPSYVVTQCGLSRQSCTHWKQRDSLPHPSALKKIADFLGVSVNYFIYEDAVECQNVTPQNDPKDDSIKEELSEREWCALQLFRSLNEEQKTSIMATLFKMHYKAQE